MGKYVVFIDDNVTVVKKDLVAIKKYLVDGFADLEDINEVYVAFVRFYVYSELDSTGSASLKVNAITEGDAASVLWTKGVHLEAEGSIKLLLVPDHDSSLAAITIGAASSGEVSGNGYAHGDWHSPKKKMNKNTGELEYSKIHIPLTKIDNSNPRTSWSLDWSHSEDK